MWDLCSIGHHAQFILNCPTACLSGSCYDILTIPDSAQHYNGCAWSCSLSITSKFSASNLCSSKSRQSTVKLVPVASLKLSNMPASLTAGMHVPQAFALQKCCLFEAQRSFESSSLVWLLKLCTKRIMQHSRSLLSKITKPVTGMSTILGICQHACLQSARYIYTANWSSLLANANLSMRVCADHLQYFQLRRAWHAEYSPACFGNNCQ